MKASRYGGAALTSTAREDLESTFSVQRAQLGEQTPGYGGRQAMLVHTALRIASEKSTGDGTCQGNLGGS